MEFLALAARTFTPNRNIRYGQHWFNVLYLYRPEVANRLRNSELDPFHKERVELETINFVEKRW